MTSFSFKHLRKITAGQTGYAFDLAAEFEEAKSVGGLATSASAFLNTAVACVLSDLDEPARQLLEKSREWLKEAIAGHERPPRYFPHATEAQRLYELATCRWLLEEVHSVELLKQSNAARECWFDAQRKVDRTSFVMTVHQYVDAGAKDQLAHRVSQLWPDLKRPLEVEVASHLLSSTPERSVVEELYRKCMGEWLTAARYLDAACWLKVGLWKGDTARRPFEIVREARNYVL